MAGGPEHHPSHPTLAEILPKESGAGDETRYTKSEGFRERAGQERSRQGMKSCKGRGLCEEHENKLANQNNSQPPGTVRTESAEGSLSGKEDAYLSL